MMDTLRSSFRQERVFVDSIRRACDRLTWFGGRSCSIATIRIGDGRDVFPGKSEASLSLTQGVTAWRKTREERNKKSFKEFLGDAGDFLAGTAKLEFFPRLFSVSDPRTGFPPRPIIHGQVRSKISRWPPQHSSNPMPIRKHRPDRTLQNSRRRKLSDLVNRDSVEQRKRARKRSFETLEQRRLLAVGAGTPAYVDVSLTEAIQSQLLGTLSTLDLAGENVDAAPALRREIPGIGQSLNDLADSPDGSIDRDWGVVLQFEQTVVSYLAAFDPTSLQYDPANEGKDPSAFGLRDALQFRMDSLGGFFDAGDVTVRGGLDQASNTLHFDLIADTNETRSVIPDLDAAGEDWTNLGIEFDPAERIDVTTSFEMSLGFGVGLDDPAGNDPFFCLDQFIVNASVGADGAVFDYSIGDAVDGTITATTFSVDADFEVRLDGAGSLADQVAVSTDGSNPLNVDFAFNDASLYATSLAAAQRTMVDSDVLDITPASVGGNVASIDLNLSGAAIIDAMRALADWIDDAIENDADLETELPLTGMTLGELLAAAGEPRVFASASGLVGMTVPTVVENAKRFTVTLDTNAGRQGIKAGDSARFKATTGDRFLATVMEVDGSEVTLEYPDARLDIPDVVDGEITIHIAGSVGDQIRAALEKYNSSHPAPTLGEVLNDLSGPLGINLSTVTLVDNKLSIQSSFAPAPIDVPVRLNFGDKLQELELGESAEYPLTISPSFRLPLELDLTPGVADDQRFKLLSDSAHEVDISIRANLADPNLVGSKDFMRTILNKINAATGGIQLAADVGISVEDADGTTTSELIAGSPTLVTSMAGGYDIPGLSITPDGLAGTTGNVTIRTTTDGSAPGVATFTDAASLATLFSGQRIQIDDVTDPLESFEDLSPSDMLRVVLQLGDSLQGIAEKLDVPGGIPLVKEAISAVADFADQASELGSFLFKNVQLTGEEEITATTGVLSADADFVIRIEDSEPVFVTVASASTADNESINDLIADVNAALVAAGLGDQIVAERANGDHPNHLTVRTIDPSVGTSLDISTLQLTAPFAAPSSGRLGENALMTFSIDTQNLEIPTTVSVRLTTSETTDNAAIEDLVDDLNQAMAVDIGDGTLLSELVRARVVGESIRISSVDSTATSIALGGGESLGFAPDQTSDENVAATELGIGVGRGEGAEAKASNIQEFIEVINEFMPAQTTLSYDAAENRVRFNLNLESEYSQDIDLDFSKAIDLGFADLNLAGGADASLEVTAGFNFAVGVDLSRPGSGEMIGAATTVAAVKRGAGVELKVGVTSAGVANPAPGTLGLQLSRFGQVTESFTVSISGDDLSDNATLEDLTFDLNDKLSAAGQPFQAFLTEDDEILLLTDDVSINGVTVTSGAFGFATGQSGDQADVVIETADGVRSEINLDGSETLADVKAKIEAAANVTVTFTGDQINVTDNTTPVDEGRMVISAAGNDFGTSSAGGDLGIIATALQEDDEDTDFDDTKTIRGEHLLLDAISELFFIDTTNTHFYANADVLAGDIDLTASMGLLELGVVNGRLGNASDTGFSIMAGVSLPDDDSDGLLRLSGLKSDAFRDALESTSPSFSYGGTATLPLSIPLLPGESPVITLTLQSDPSDPLRPDFDVSAPNLSELIGDFRNLSLSDLAGLLREVVDMLRDSEIDGLNTTIPVINQSANEMLAFTDGLLSAAERLLENVDVEKLTNLRDDLLAELETLGASQEQLDLLESAIGQVGDAINPVHTYTLTVTDGNGTAFETGILDSEATTLDIESAVAAAIGQDDVVTVTGNAGGPYTLTLSNTLGDVSIDSSSESGMTLQFETVTEGVAGSVDEVQEMELVATSGLAAALFNLQATVDDLQTQGIDVSTLTPILDEMGGNVISTENLGEFLTDLLEQELGLPVTVVVDFVDADSVEAGYQAALKMSLDINPTVTRTVGFDLSLDDYGPVTLGAAGDIGVEFGGNIDLDLGFRFDSLTPYVFDTTNFAVTAKIDAPVSLTAGIGGFEAELSGVTGLHKRGDASQPAGIIVLLNSGVPSDANTIGAIPISQLFDGPLADKFTFALDGEVDAIFDATLAGVPIADAIDVDFDLGSAPSGGTPTIDYSNLSTGVTNYLNSLTDLGSMSLDQLIGGTRTVLDTIESGLTSDLLSSLPLIGESVDLGSSFIGELNRMVDELERLIQSSEDSVDALVDDIQQLIFDSLGPGGANLLKLDALHHDDETIANADEVADSRDVDVFLSDLSSTPASEIEFFINLQMAGRDVIDADFDLGLDAVVFEFETEGGVRIAWDYEFSFGLGINLEDGFFFQLNPNTTTDAAGFPTEAGGAPEIELNAEVSLRPGTTLAGELFFLNLNAESNAVEDFNGNGIAETLNEAADGVDYNRDGDMNDLLVESDVNGDGRLSRGTALAGEIFIDVANPDNDPENRLTFGELRGDNDLFSAGIRTEAFVDLALSADTDLAALPALSADLTVDWAISFSTSQGFVGGLPDVTFHDVSLDLGSFFEAVAGPAFDLFAKYTESVRPVIDFLSQEVPGFSDLSKFTGGPAITFLDLGAYASGQSRKIAAARMALGTIKGILDAVDQIKNFSDADGMIINFGTFHLTGEPVNASGESLGTGAAAGQEVTLANAARSGSPITVRAGGVEVDRRDYKVIHRRGAAGNPETVIKFLVAQVGDLTVDYTHTANKVDVTDSNTKVKAPEPANSGGGVSSDVFNQIGTGNSKATRTTSTLKKLNRSADSGGHGLKIPLLSDPSNVFKLFTGETADLIQWDIPTLDLDFGFSAKFGPLGPTPIFARVGGSLDTRLDFSIGLDTRGMSDTGNFLDGLYFGDRAGVTTGRDINEVDFNLRLNAGVGIDIFVAGIYLVGGARGDLGFDWNDLDGNGKLYLDELVTLAKLKSRPNIPGACVFDARGSVNAEIGLDWWVPLKSGYIPIVNEELFRFDHKCDIATNLAQVEGGGKLVIHAGPNASKRSPGISRDDSETFSVTQLADGSIEVTYDSVGTNSQVTKIRRQYKNVNEIYFNGGAGNDTITVDSSVDLPVTLIGGDGEDVLVGGSGTNRIAGGRGNDTITTFGANDTFLFEDGWGVDTITDGGGTNAYDFSAMRSAVTVVVGETVSVVQGGNTIVGPDGSALSGIGRVIGGSGRDTLVTTRVLGNGSENVWTIDSLGGGDINGEFHFDRFENLTGGDPDDEFHFEGGLVAGVIRGGGGDNVLNFAMSGLPVEVDLARARATSQLGLIDLHYLGSFTGIHEIIGGGSTHDTLVGPSGNATWNVTALDTGTVNSVAFSGFENLTGNSGDDTFVIAASGRLSGKLSGTKTTGAVDRDRIDLSAFSASQNVKVTGRNEGDVSGIVDFLRVESLTGSAASDHFVIDPLAGLTGMIDGGGGDTDHLDYSMWSTGVTVDFSTGVNQIGTVDGMEFLTGGSAADRLTGNTSNNRIIGRGGADVIDGLAGNNVLIGDDASVTASLIRSQGGQGNDTITAGDGNNIIVGGQGDDEVMTGSGHNVVGGDEVIVRISGSDVVLIQSLRNTNGGNDSIQIGSGNDWVIAGNGDDTVRDSGGRNVILGDAGMVQSSGGLPTLAASSISVDSGGDSIASGDGVDAIIAGGRNDVISGGAGDNYILADDGEIRFVSGLPVSSTLQTSRLDGNDRVTTLGGRDRIFTGNGDNRVLAGDGNDDVIGGDGIDTLGGEGGNDWLVGMLGDDTIEGGFGDDVVFGGLALGSRSDYELGTSDFQQPPEFVSRGFAPLTGILITPSITGGQSIDGVVDDGRDVVTGDEGNDVLFGGWDVDELRGGAGVDYVDAGASNDLIVEGNEGDDVVRGGSGDDIVHGNDGIDQTYGDDGDDTVYGDRGDASEVQEGQNTFGGAGRDSLFAYAPAITNLTQFITQTSLVGDRLFGGPDSDLLYGNARQELLDGGSGDDWIGGDDRIGPSYLTHADAGIGTEVDVDGADDTILGGSGDDQLFGGGGDDEIWGGLGTDYILGQEGSDVQYGGSGIDLFVLPTSLGSDGHLDSGIDTIDGHFGNSVPGDDPDDNAVDILVVDGTQNDDTILVARQRFAPSTQVAVLFGGVAIPVNLLDGSGSLLVDQFRISGLGGNDTIGFYTEVALESGALPAALPNIEALNLNSIAQKTNDWVGVFDGNSGDDTLIGSAGRDRLDGGSGSDTAYGFGDDDRLWGDGGGGSTSDHDILFAGQGNDDLIGGQGTNDLYAWSFDPALGGQFGVFVDLAGGLHTNDGDLNNNGVLDSDEASPTDPKMLPYELETTGLNRLLGSQQADHLYGGTTLDFMYGNGGEDQLYRADGTTFESADGALAGDEWKEFAKESDQVWYVGGTNARDEIDIDFVTEPGLLADHHVISRRTNNGDNDSFSVEVRLDFSATDGQGNPVWNADDLGFKLDQLLSSSDAQQRSEELANIEESGSEGRRESELIQQLLPPEGDFLVILVDALDGNDEIIVGPTVQKSVWIDAGPGNDVVEIRSGNPILVDKAESSLGVTGLASRNDIVSQAYDLDDSRYAQYTGLSLDSASDVDWFTFTPEIQPAADSSLKLASASLIDKLMIEIFEIDGVLPGASIASATAEADQAEILDLSALVPGTKYLLSVRSTNVVPTLYDLQFNLDGAMATDLRTFDLSLREDTVRRDVIIGGDGNDILQGGAGEDWIFGNEGSDVLTGGYDRQASDLLFGGPGDDTFQIIPDALPLLGNQSNTRFDPGTQTYIPTASDQFIGGDGNDRVLYLGGDQDAVGNEVPDFISMRYNTALHRYEFTSLIWDVSTQSYQLTSDPSGRIVLAQEYLFFQTRDIDQTQFEMGAGDDVVRLDSGFQFLPLTADINDRDGDGDTTELIADLSQASEHASWGMDLGDRQQGAFIPILVSGGTGDDLLVGTPDQDLIRGGDGNDRLVGMLGNDVLEGGGDDDELFGNDVFDVSSISLSFPVSGVALPTATSEAFRHNLALPFQAEFAIEEGANVDDEFESSNAFEQAAYALEGDFTNQRLSGWIPAGDFNGDSHPDFIVSGNLRSYILLGPVDLPGVSNIEQSASYVIDHGDLGRPGMSHGDINGDGVSDLTFIRRVQEGTFDSRGVPTGDYLPPETIVTIVFGFTTPPDGIEWDRDLVSNLTSRNSRTFTLRERDLSVASPPSVSVLNYDGDQFDDVFVFSEQSPVDSSLVAGARPTLGFVFAGQDVRFTDAQAASTTLNSIGSISKSQLGLSASGYTATLVGDVNGDGLDEILFTDQTNYTFGPGLPVHATDRGQRVIGLGDINGDGYDDVAFYDTNSVRIHLGSASATSSLGPAYRVITGSNLQPSSGDFNGDGSIDFAVAGVDANGQSAVHVFDSIVDQPATVTLQNADRVIPYSGLAPTERRYAAIRGGIANLPFQAITGTEELTMHFVMRANYRTANRPDYFMNSHGTDTLTFSFVSDTTAQLYIEDNNRSEIENVVWEIPTVSDAFHSVTLTVSHTSGSVELFIDGVSMGSRFVGNWLIAGGFNSSELLLGEDTAADIDDFAVYRRTLTSEQVGDLHEMGIDNFAISPNHHYRFNETLANREDIFDSVGTLHGSFFGFDDGFVDDRHTMVEFPDGMFAGRSTDINGDSVADLIIPSGGLASRFGDDNAGRIFTVFGVRETMGVPASAFQLENFSVPGSGSFVADLGTGVTLEFLDGDSPFAIAAGEERWFQFSTLGDGLAGNQILLLGSSPAADLNANLIDAKGVVLAKNRQAFDLRTVAAGSYYLQVNSSSAQNFTIEFDAPERGQSWTREEAPDRDRLLGGAGRDLVVGGPGLDKLLGGEGGDEFVGEAGESLDRSSSETLVLPEPAELSYSTPVVVRDPVVEFLDANLKAAIHGQLGRPVTGTNVVHSELTESALASLLELDLAGQNVGEPFDLRSLKNLRTLDASDNVGISSIENLKGLTQLRSLDLRGTSVNPVSDATAETLSALPNLESLKLPVPFDPPTLVAEDNLESATIGSTAPANWTFLPQPTSTNPFVSTVRVVDNAIDNSRSVEMKVVINSSLNQRADSVWSVDLSGTTSPVLKFDYVASNSPAAFIVAASDQGSNSRELLNIRPLNGAQTFEIDLRSVSTPLTSGYEIQFVHFGKQNSASLIDNLSIVETANGELSHPDQEFVFSEGQSVSVPLAAVHNWRVLDANEFVVASGINSSVRFNPSDDGFFIAQFTRDGGSTYDDWFPILVRNESPQITGTPDFSVANGGQGVLEGQVISLGTAIQSGVSRNIPVLIDGVSVGDLVLNDPSIDDAANLAVTVDLVDPSGREQGLIQRSLEFDNQALSLNPNILDGESSLTTAFWFKTDSLERETVLHATNEAGETEFEIVVWIGGSQVEVIDQGQSLVIPVSTMSLNAFHHFSVVRNVEMQTVELSIDGNRHSVTPPAALEPISTSGGSFLIGKSLFPEFRGLTGILDEMTIWNRALHEGEISKVRENVFDVRSKNLLAYWSMNEGGGTVLRDLSPRRNDIVVSSEGMFDATVTHNYPINGSLADSLGGPSLVSLGGSVLPTRYDFEAGGGLSLSGAIHPESYRIDMVFELERTSSWRKIIDFKNLGSDNGLYVLDGQFVFYGSGANQSDNQVGPAGAVEAFETYTLSLRRDAASDLVELYLDGVLQLSFEDTLHAAVFDTTGNIIYFMRDDNVTGNEHAIGSIESIVIHDQVPVESVGWSQDVPPGFDSGLVLVDNGEYVVRVSVQDDSVAMDAVDVPLLVGNVAPTISSLNATVLGRGSVDVPIEFDARDVIDPGTEDTFTYLWEVTSNNGQQILTSSSIEFDFTPQYAGEYTVKLTVTDSDGDASVPMEQVYSVEPTVVMTLPSDPVNAGTVVEITSEQSSPLAPSSRLRGTNSEMIRGYSWLVRSPGLFSARGTGSSFEFVPNRAGDYTVRLTINEVLMVDGVEQSRLSRTETQTLTVGAETPLPIVAPTTSAQEGDVLSFALEGLPELIAGAERSITWSVLGGAFNVIEVDDPETYSFQPIEDGDFSVSVIVSDLIGGQTVLRSPPAVNAVIENAAPVLVVDGVAGIEGAPVSLLASVSDPGESDTQSFTIDWGDESTPTTGNVIGNLVTATHTYVQDGEHDAVITITDSDGATRQSVSKVVIRNADPVAANDSGLNTNADAPLPVLELLGNDGDAGLRDVLSVASVDAVSQWGAAVTLVGGVVRYDPRIAPMLRELPVGQNVVDTFAYVVTDDAGGQDTGTVSITVAGVNDAPIADDDSIALESGDLNASLNVIENDRDVDFATVLGIANVNGELISPIVGDFGTLAWAANGEVTYMIDPANMDVLGLRDREVLIETFEILVTDGIDTDASSLTVTIAGVNDVPVAVADSLSVDADSETIVQEGGVLANDFDVDRDDEFSVTAVNGDEGNVGTEIRLPSGALLHVHADGDYRYDPAGAFDALPVGVSTMDSFEYTITDLDGATSTATVTVTIAGTNETPNGVQLSGNKTDGNASVNEVVGEILTRDPDSGDTHTVTIQDDPSGAFGIMGSQLVVANPAALQVGQRQLVTVRSADAGGKSIDQVFAVDVDYGKDITAPQSAIAALPSTALDLFLPISVGGIDAGGSASQLVSGIKEYRLYVSEDGGAFTLFDTVSPDQPFSEFVATSNHSYFFRSLAVDHAGNVESKSTVDTQIIVGDFDAPETRVVSAVANSAGLFDVTVSGRDTGGGSLVFFDVYVSIDGGVAQLAGTTGAGAADGSGTNTASLVFQGITDGTQHSYRFFSIGRDSESNIESAPRRSQDVIQTDTFADEGLQATGIDVARGAAQRSFVRELDILFSSETGLASMLDPGRIVLERFAIDATDVTPGTGVAISDFTAERVSDRIRLDFGADGITDAPDSDAGDGFYRVLLDVDGDGDFIDGADANFEFHRLLGDADGDGAVTMLDADLVLGQIGQSGTNLEGDMNGDRNVDFTDYFHALDQAALNRQLASGLKDELDD